MVAVTHADNHMGGTFADRGEQEFGLDSFSLDVSSCSGVASELSLRVEDGFDVLSCLHDEHSACR